jgi:hypothetical protein
MSKQSSDPRQDFSLVVVDTLFVHPDYMSPRGTWSPTPLQIQTCDIEHDIDANPLAYFLSSSDDDETDDDNDEADEARSTRRHSSPSEIGGGGNIAAATAFDMPVSDVASIASYSQKSSSQHSASERMVPLTLKEFSDSYDQSHGVTSLKRDTLHWASTLTLNRGRGVFKSTRGRNRTRTRSLPSRRAHVWREPSPDVWSIPEEDEDGHTDTVKIATEYSLGNKRAMNRFTSLDAAHDIAETDHEVLKKAKKRVRFSL